MDSTPLLDRYQLLSELGRGGTGIVYRAHDSLLKRDVAVKVLGGASLTSEAQSRLLDEARSAASINHPGIVGIYDAALSGQTAFVVMELVEGPSLHDLAFPDWIDAARVGREICAALEHAHRNSIVHRDLKPENILFTPEGRVKLVDFGLARPDRLTSDGRRLAGRVAALHRAGAGTRAAGGRANRPVLPGSHPVRAGRRPSALHGRGSAGTRGAAHLCAGGPAARVS